MLLASWDEEHAYELSTSLRRRNCLNNMANQQESGDGSADYTLHYFPFSLYSLMVRFSLGLGRQLNSESAPRVQLKFVNLQTCENLTEEYLTTVNSRGQVRW